MAVTDPVPVPVISEVLRLTLLSVCAVTLPPPPVPLLGDVVYSTGEFEVRVVGVVRVSPVVVTASVLISSVWLLSNWLAWSWAAIRSREDLELLSFLAFCVGGGVGVDLLEEDCVGGVGVRCCCCCFCCSGDCSILLGVVGWWALSREVTLVMLAVLTSREETLRGGEVLTWRRVVVMVVVLKYKEGNHRLDYCL